MRKTAKALASDPLATEKRNSELQETEAGTQAQDVVYNVMKIVYAKEQKVKDSEKLKVGKVQTSIGGASIGGSRVT